MNQTTEIIVYRNPAEKAVWDLMSDGTVWPIMVGAVVFVIAFVVAVIILDRVAWRLVRSRTRHFLIYNGGYLAFFLALLAGWLTVQWMWI